MQKLKAGWIWQKWTMSRRRHEAYMYTRTSFYSHSIAFHFYIVIEKDKSRGVVV